MRQGSFGQLGERFFSCLEAGGAPKDRPHFAEFESSWRARLAWAAEGGCPYVSVVAVGSFSNCVGTGALACAGQVLARAAEGGCPYASVVAVGSFSTHVGTGALACAGRVLAQAAEGGCPYANVVKRGR